MTPNSQTPTPDLGGLIFRWFRHQMAQLWSIPSTRSNSNVHLMMGCPLWGKIYTERFGLYCLPTLIGGKNLEALANRCRIVLFTDEAGLLPLMEIMRPLKNHGIDTLVLEIPRDVMEAFEKYKYQLLGAVQNILVQMAARAGMGFSMLMPDHLHGPHFYENLFRIAEKSDAIIQTGMSANIETAKVEIETYRQPDSTLVIPDRDLGDLGWRHLHKQMKVYCMNGAKIPQRLPNSHYVFWQGIDHITIYCCHMNPVYMSANLCERAPLPKTLGNLVSTLDTKLPDFLQGSVYVVEADDGMTFVEISDDDKVAAPGYVSAEQFITTCWRQVKFSDAYMPYFKQCCQVPIHPQKTFIADREIERQHGQLVKLLEAGKGRVAVDTIRRTIGAI